MQTIIDFIVSNYLWFLIISIILIFALIGYLVDTNEKKDTTPTNMNPNLDNSNPTGTEIKAEESPMDVLNNK